MELDVKAHQAFLNRRLTWSGVDFRREIMQLNVLEEKASRKKKS